MKKISIIVLVVLFQILLFNESIAQFVPDVQVAKTFTQVPKTKLSYKPIKPWKNRLIGTANMIIQTKASNYSFSQFNPQNRFSYNQHFDVCNKQYFIERPFSIMKITY